MDIVIWTDPTSTQVIALTPPGGLSASEAQAQMVPSGVASFIVDSESLPREHDIRSWVLGSDGVVTVDANWKPAPPAVLKRSQIMRQLAVAGKLDAARSAVDAADSLTQELWASNDWHLSDLQSEPFSAMVSALGIDLPTFWTAAAEQQA